MEIEKIKKEILPLIEKEGFLLVDIEIKRIEGKLVLEITIDREGGVNTSHCQFISKKIEKVLDQKELFKERYYLVVFSKGIKENEN